jgi:NADH:ubiquinone oxidoreductase subunit H
MAHAMTSAMTVMMALMMIVMAGSALAWTGRKLRAAVARRGHGGPPGAQVGPSLRGDG